jgi:predicted FMN-binding regulatory protein PaiB
VHADGALEVRIAAKANPTLRLGERGAEVVVAFTGASAYISPSFCPSKHETHQVVPTWNYRAAHVRGTPADQRGALAGLRADPAAAEAAELIAQRLKY